MNVIIPLGGMGERFFNEGYSKPKPLIQILGKPMILHVVDNLKLDKDDKLIIIYNKCLDKYGFSNLIKQYCKNAILIDLNIQTEGAVETILYGLECIKKTNNTLLNNKTIIIDGDTVYNIDIFSYFRNEEHNSVICFNDNGIDPIYSYVKIDENFKILDIKEKKKISNYANSGCYFFKNSNVLMTYCHNIIKENIREKNEFYTSCVIQKMLNDKLIFKAIIINASDFDCIGTPIQLKQYSIKNECTHDKKRFCFDLDNTLVTFPEIQNDYTSVKPIHKNIEILRKLKSIGHTIIIYTARRMRTFNGNVGKIIKDIGTITLETLDLFCIPYDEIYFGKPYADFYIDDLAINSYDQIDKSIGFYKNVVKERNHNHIEIIENKYIKKTTTIKNSLLGEIYYYKNIPIKLMHFFPTFINSGNDEYTIEKINGTPLSIYFTNEILNETLLLNLLNTIKYIHSSINDVDMKIINKKINIYSNYSKKIKERYVSFDYSIFYNYEEVYKNIIDFCDTYELNQNGIMGVIHGDSVFSNIILTYDANFKFIDMKGKCGDTETIFGDIFYDYAKIYQSLIGYDEIVLNEIVSNKYRSNLLKCFNNFIINEYNVDCLHNIKMITNSLLFSLIPLHNDEKIYNYYNLINVNL